jgi:hypothetical protein
MARPRKNDKGERRSDFVGFYVTPTERAKLNRRAAATGRTVSEFSREVLLSPAKEPAPAACDPQAAQGVRVQIRHAGNNLNQLTHIANQRGDLPSQKLLAAAIEEVVAALRKVRSL